MFKKLKKNLAWWLFKDLIHEGLPYIKVGTNTTKIYPDSIKFEALTADPTPETGKIWYRSDLDSWRYSPDGTTIKEIPTEAGKSIIEMTPDEIASIIESTTDDDLAAERLETLGDGLAAEVLNSSNITTAKIISILSSSKISANKVQSILYRMAEFKYINRLVDILTYNASDVVLSADTTYTGINRFRTLDLAGYTYTADGQPHVIIADTINDSVGTGSIIKTPTGGAGGPSTYSDGRGGDGGGGLIVVARQINVQAIRANGEDGEDATTAQSGTYTKYGVDGGSGIMGVVGTDAPGDGGNGGYGGGSGCGGGGGGKTGGTGGKLANTTTYTAGGTGGSITLDTYNSYTDIYLNTIKGVIDWWIVNVLGKTPSNTMEIPNWYGAGGGGGGDYQYGANYGSGGGGGGSGGHLIIVCDTITANTVEANGGNGGDSGTSGTVNEGGGGGGGGGVVYVIYRTSATITTLQASGGSGGSGDLVGSPGGDGVAKAIQI